MRNLRQALWGIALALVSIFLILGGFVLSFAESGLTRPVDTPTPSITPTWQPFTPEAASSTPLPPTLTPSQPPPPTNCPPPSGWLAYLVQPGDTLEKVATVYQTSVDSLVQANCLLTRDLMAGVYIYVPPLPTQTPIPCGPPPGWIVYVVQTGDTLYHLSQAYGISVTELQNANCMSGTLLRLGQRLYVPPWATLVPSPTFSNPPAITNTPTGTPTATSTPPATPTDTATATDTTVPTDTELPTATPTATTP